MIRIAVAADLPLLPAIERSAAQRFAGTHMDFAVGHSTSPVDALEAALGRETLWVAIAADRPVGFLFAEPVNEWLHILEASVALAQQGAGHGGRLIEAAADAAARHGCDRLSLTTDRDLAWNARFYARRGFVELAAAEQPDWLACILVREARSGLDPARRIAMARWLKAG